MSSYVVKRGYASVKEDGLRSFIWSKKWLLLREQTLTIHRNENTYQSQFLIFLKDVESVQRVDNKPYCFEIVTKDKTHYVSCRSDEELYSWMDEIYQRSPLMGISNPTNFVHQVHVGFDPLSGLFTGLPTDWKSLLESSNISKDEITKNPQAVLDVLEFYTENLVSSGGVAGSGILSRDGPVAPQRVGPPSGYDTDPSPSNSPGPLRRDYDRMDPRDRDYRNESSRNQYDYNRMEGIGTGRETGPDRQSSHHMRHHNRRPRSVSSPNNRNPPHPHHLFFSCRSSRNDRPRQDDRYPERTPTVQRSVEPASVIASSAAAAKKEPRMSTMSEAQIMEKLRVVVSKSDPLVLYTKIKKWLIVNEILVMKESQHPNIVNYLDSYLVKGELWVVMEFMEGGPLTDIIDNNTMTEPQIAAICLETIKGLNHLHLRQIIHRDIKSDNVLLNADGNVKITDFGFCAKLTSDREYGAKVDIWSLGIMAIEMIEVNRPLYLIATNGTPTLKSPEKLSSVFKNFLGRCLEVDVTKRATSDELLQHPFLRLSAPLSTLAPLVKRVKK
ncbi:kinase-like domain-containing protein [Chytridium lagenaria]|nr:kinase-like domain-containing protein [Chytridium lagenaria]